MKSQVTVAIGLLLAFILSTTVSATEKSYGDWTVTVPPAPGFDMLMANGGDALFSATTRLVDANGEEKFPWVQMICNREASKPWQFWIGFVGLSQSKVRITFDNGDTHIVGLVSGEIAGAAQPALFEAMRNGRYMDIEVVNSVTGSPYRLRASLMGITAIYNDFISKCKTPTAQQL